MPLYYRTNTGNDFPAKPPGAACAITKPLNTAAEKQYVFLLSEKSTSSALPVFIALLTSRVYILFSLS